MGRHRRSAAGRAATGRADHSGYSDHLDHPEHSELRDHSDGLTDAADPSASAGFSGPAGSGAYENNSGAYGFYRGRAEYGGFEGYDAASSDAYLFGTSTAETSANAATGAAGRRRGSSHRRRRRASAPVRTGLLGVSAAVAMGAVAVASGLVPGGDNYTLGGGDTPGAVRTAGSPSGLDPQGGANGSADGGRATPGRGSDTPAPTPSESNTKPSQKPSGKPSTTPSKPGNGTGETGGKNDRDGKRDEAEKGEGPGKNGKDTGKGSGTGRPDKSPAPSRPAPEKPKVPPTPANPSADETTAEAEVLALVNQERANVGCRPVAADPGLATLAGDFSADMAERDFFAHTDPDGATPWDRAEKVGIQDLGGENIARGQANAQSVMDAWMNSPGHRANILNCDYKTLGVGAHFAPGGPWWTQDFGF
ncbi:CAP domain-containing protein [Streptomyces flavofungini]|uniref:CAP domain-containing protein n=1 Tax=Streptomyces flavofungini TaxID=68200 RepID=A0ABS0WZX5_9ACTN|nr:CAP domain-containing protein [Streptomyces flavofungini]